MTNKRTALAVAFAAALSLFAFGCSSDDPGFVIETGASSDSATVAEAPQPTETPSLEESFAHDDDSTAEHADGENTSHDETHEEATEPESADHQDEPTQAEEGSGDEQADDGVVPIVMNEFGYLMDPAEYALGSTVTFKFTNKGAIEHEAMFGTPHEQEEFHADTDHGGEGHHGDVVAITLGAGESGSLSITFEEPGEMVIGCHLPGHWEAGMATTLTVA